MTQQTVLHVESLGKRYVLYDSPRARLFALFGGRARGAEHWALKDVSFSLGRGQCLGLIGDNGAGKSTLLKLVAGTLRANLGSVRRDGRLTAILELGAGFHPEFSGRENLFFAGALTGLSERELKAREEEIIAFSELHDAIDRPVKTYSSGMVVRLAFALVTAVEPEVLIIDEALAVGDQHFQKKCVERIEAFRRNGCTILFCSHSLYHVRQLCDVALWLDGGRARACGPTEAVLAAYESHVRSLDAEGRDPAVSGETPRAALQAPPPSSERRAGILALDIAGLGGGDPPLLESRDLAVTLTAFVHAEECPSMGVMLEQANGVGITSVVTHGDGARPVAVSPGVWRATVTFPDLPLHSGEYVVSGYLFDSEGIVVYDEWLHCARFAWVFPSLTPGLVRLPHRWT